MSYVTASVTLITVDTVTVVCSAINSLCRLRSLSMHRFVTAGGSTPANRTACQWKQEEEEEEEEEEDSRAETKQVTASVM